MKYANVIFDLYGTLVDIHTEEDKPELWEKLALEYARYGAFYTADALQRGYRQQVLFEEQKLGAGASDTHEAHPEIHLEEVFRFLFAAKGVKADDELVNRVGKKFRALSMEYIGLYEGALELLTALRENGAKVWLLSNAQRMFTEYEMETLGLTPHFDGIYLSSDYGCKKPDPGFFRVLLDGQKIETDTAIMIGNDGTCDIGGAKTVGLDTMYICSGISPKEPLPEADYVLEEMDLKKVQELLLRNGAN